MLLQDEEEEEEEDCSRACLPELSTAPIAPAAPVCVYLLMCALDNDMQRDERHVTCSQAAMEKQVWGVSARSMGGNPFA